MSVFQSYSFNRIYYRKTICELCSTWGICKPTGATDGNEQNNMAAEVRNNSVRASDRNLKVTTTPENGSKHFKIQEKLSKYNILIKDSVILFFYY